MPHPSKKKRLQIRIFILFVMSAILLPPPFYSYAATDSLRRTGGEIGLEISHIKYKEPGIMEESGMMYGIDGSYVLHNPVNRFMFGLDGRLSYGQVDYDGKLSDNTPYTVNNIDDCIFDGRFLIGYDCPPANKFAITPFVGIGYRYLYDEMNKDPKGYRRESNYFYSPVGVDTIAELGKGWFIGLMAEYDLFWYGLQRSHMGDVYPGVDVVNNDQRRGYGARGSLKIIKQTKTVDFVIEPFIRYWNIKQSDTAAITFLGTYIIGYAWEPKNNSTECGVKIAAKF